MCGHWNWSSTSRRPFAPMAASSQQFIENNWHRAAEILSTEGSVMSAAPAFTPSERLQFGVITTGKRHAQASKTDIGSPSLKLGRIKADAVLKQSSLSSPNWGPTK